MVDHGTAWRCKTLRLAYGHTEQMSFAKWIGIAPGRWGNFERGFPLSIAVANVLREKTGVSLDWLYHGDWRSMSDYQYERFQKTIEKYHLEEPQDIPEDNGDSAA